MGAKNSKVAKKRKLNCSRKTNEFPGTGQKLLAFLMGTIDSQSSLKLLRGNGDILRMIWIYACSEWWQLHIQPYVLYENLQSLQYSMHERNPIADLSGYRHFFDDLAYRNKFFDCPLAILQRNTPFPSIGTMPVTCDPIAINMMPFDLLDLEATLPEFCHGYIPMIERCRSYLMIYKDMLAGEGIKQRPLSFREKPREPMDYHDIRNRIAYLTIDERPVEEAGKSHRRGGVHVECPGALRRKEVADKSKYTPDLSFYHHWGHGHIADEYLVGGIFIASNVSNSTAVWNCRIHDTFGDIIGPHGSLERCRELLGPATKTLEAGELVWLSDRTPHESLPISDSSVRRQFFRLVVGEIGFWYAEHNTRNPLGFAVPSHVPVITGNKFELVKEIIPIVWESGSEEEMRVAREEAEFRKLLYRQAIGFLADDLLKLGIYNRETLRRNYESAEQFVQSLDPHLYSSSTRRFMDSALLRVLDCYDYC